MCLAISVASKLKNRPKELGRRWGGGRNKKTKSFGVESAESYADVKAAHKICQVHTQPVHVVSNSFNVQVLSGRDSYLNFFPPASNQL